MNGSIGALESAAGQAVEDARWWLDMEQPKDPALNVVRAQVMATLAVAHELGRIAEIIKAVAP